MKKGLHPTNYRPVVFADDTADFSFLTRSTAETKDTITWEDGKEYPLVKVHISSASHPFYTGQEKLIDIEGRVDRFKARQAAQEGKRDAMAKKAAKKLEKQNKEKAATTKIGAPVNTYQGKKPNTQKKPSAAAEKKEDTKDKQPKTASE